MEPRSPAERQRLVESLALLRSGAPTAADRLCHGLMPLVDAYVHRHLGAGGRRWQDSVDVVQQILLEVARELPELPPEADLDVLLSRVQRIATCRVRDAIRNHGHLLGESAGPDPVAAIGAASHTRGPVTAQDDRRWMEELVARLPERYAPVVRLCGLEGLSFVEAAARLGLEPDTVRKRYEAARLALARRFGSRDRA